jgi:hypothetical protein
MKVHKIIMLLILIACSIHLQSFAQEREVFIREDFSSMDDWKPLHFPKIKEHTKYSIENSEDKSFLKAESSASASGIIFKKKFNVFEYPKARWRWKVSNIYTKGNAKDKSGDDYPIRIYIIFEYDPDTALFGKKIKYGLARKIYGEYPPDSSLNYIWANRRHQKNIITNTYAKEAQMIVLQAGKENAGTWQEQEVNMLEDYRKAFRKNPPATASIAIMNDSDNT